MNGDTIHDSTQIIERLERDYPEPPLYPADPDDAAARSSSRSSSTRSSGPTSGAPPSRR